MVAIACSWRTRRLAALAGLIMLALGLGVGPSAASADTWTGTWHRSDVAVGDLFLSQSGNAVSGHYNWNPPGGSVSGTVSGNTFTGGFNEAHYSGSFVLTLSGKAFSGSYSGMNKDTGGPVSGPFTGTCIAGPCLQNGTSTLPPPSVQSAPSPSGFNKAVTVPAPSPGNAIADNSPPLGNATSVTADLEGLTPDEIAFVPFLAPRLRWQCFLNFYNGIFGTTEPKFEKSADGRWDFRYKLVVASLPKALSQLAGCLAYVDALTQAAVSAHRTIGDHPSASTAAAGCGTINVGLAIQGHGSKAKGKTSHGAPPGVRETCSIRGGKLVMSLKAGSGKHLSQVVGSTLHLVVLRDRRAGSAGPLSFSYHKR